MTSKQEIVYQGDLAKLIETELLPGSFVIRGNPKEIQGIPDLFVFHGPRWAALEVKMSAGAAHEPNQDYYIDLFNAMSFAAFIYPENEQEVLYALQQSLGA